MAARRKKSPPDTAAAASSEGQTFPAAIPQPPLPFGPPPAPLLPSGSVKGGVYELFGNVKGGGRVRLGRCTAFVSTGNRSGKTRWLDTMMLALRGRHQIGHTADALLALGDGRSIVAGAIDSDGKTIASFQISEEQRTPLHMPPAGLSASEVDRLFPLSSVDDLLRFGTPLAREEFFRRFAGGEEAATPSGLDERQTEIWSTAVLSLAPGAKLTIDMLADLPGIFRKDKIAHGARAVSLREEAERRRKAVAESAGIVTTEIIAQARQAVDAAVLWSRTRQYRDALAHVVDDHARLYAEADAQLRLPVPSADLSLEAREPLSREIEATRAVFDAAEVEAARLHDLVRAGALIIQMRKLMATSSDGTACLACGGKPHVADWNALIAHGEAFLSGYHQQHAEAVTARRAAEERWQQACWALEAAEDAAKRTHAVHVARNSEVVSRLQNIVKRRAEIESVVVADAQDPGVSVDQARARLDALVRAQAELEAIEQLVGQGRREETLAEICRALERVAEDASVQGSATIIKNAESSVRAYLPPGFDVKLVLTGEGRRTYRWDVQGADGQWHRKGAISGAELAAVRVALACAWAENLPIRIVLLDDSDLAGFSAANVRAFLTKMQECANLGRITQVVVAWSRPEEIPDGWTVIRTDQ